MNLSKYKACICEGAGEAAIIDILVDNDLLIFKREEMLDEKVIRIRNAIVKYQSTAKIPKGEYCLSDLLK